MRLLQAPALGFVIAGMLTGVSLQAAYSGSAELPKNRNVVVLRAEKRITIEKPMLHFSDIAREMERETGYTFQLAQRYVDDKATYAVLLRDAPLSHVLASTAYLSGGKWERQGRNYRLRPLTEREKALDVTRYEAAFGRVRDYLSQVDPNDPSLSPTTAGLLKDTSGLSTPDPGFEMFPSDDMANWKIKTTDQFLTVTYSNTQDNANSHSEQFSSTSFGLH